MVPDEDFLLLSKELELFYEMNEPKISFMKTDMRYYFHQKLFKTNLSDSSVSRVFSTNRHQF